MTNPFLPVAISALSNLSLAGTFLFAWIYSDQYGYFIVNTGLLIFLIEFLSIHSSAMFAAIQRSYQNDIEDRAGFVSLYEAFPRFFSGFFFSIRAIIFCFYLIFISSFWFIYHNFYPLFYFVLSLFGKVFVPPEYSLRRWVTFQVCLFMLTAFLIIFFSSILSGVWQGGSLFSCSDGVCTGLFADEPRTLLSWGILYYVSLAVAQVCFYFRPSWLEKLLPGR